MAKVTSEQLDAVVEGQTVARGFLRTVTDHPDAVALRWMNDDESWGAFTFAEYAAMVAKAAAGLQAAGVGRGDRIVLMMRNIPAFHVTDMAASFVGATPISIYNSSSSDQIEYLVNHCAAKWALVEDVGFLERFLKVRPELKTIDHLGVITDPDRLAPDDVFEAADFLDQGEADLEKLAAATEPSDLATVIYTSGTTGPPKGVMISNYNVCWTIESLERGVREHPSFESLVGKRVVSYLPMAHIAERMVSHYQGAFLGYEVTTCPDPGLLSQYLVAVRPNLIFGVPRVWEKIYAGVNAALAADPDKSQQFDDGLAAALPLIEKIDWGTGSDDERATWDFLLGAFEPIRALVGLDQCELAITGAAPLPVDILRWYRAIGVDLTEIYGMSESSGPMTWRSVKVKPGTVGPAIAGCEVRLADDDEICCRGGNVFEGYLNDPEKTAETTDDDGWLHSGDIGEVDDDGYFKVVDRKKELIITAGGKNISPANLEAALKMMPLVGQACAIGDQRPFVSALVVLDPEIAPAWARSEGLEFSDLADLATKTEVTAEIDRALAEVMAPFNNAERVKKVVVLGEEWLPDSEVLTPTSKLKRRGIHTHYADEIESLYS